MTVADLWVKNELWVKYHLLHQNVFYNPEIHVMQKLALCNS